MPAEIHVLDSGVLLATGQQTLPLLLATMAELPLLAPDENTVLPQQEELHVPVLLSYSSEPRILLDAALPLLQAKANEGFPVLLLLPAPAEPQYKTLFKALQTLQNKAGIELVTPDRLPERLGTALDDLQQGRIKQFTVFGLDSLTGLATLYRHLEQRRLRTQLRPDGRAAGEGCGWFTLGLASTEQQPGIRWQSGSWTTEPATPPNTTHEYRGLAASLAPLLQQALPEAPDTWAYARRQTPEDDLEAFMGFQHHWGNRGYYSLEQLCPARRLGDLGAAALPVAVALACERLTFKPYPKTSVVVSDSHPDGRHFSLLLSTRQPAQQ